MHQDIVSSRLKYRFDGDLDKFLQVSLSAIGDFLLQVGRALGRFDALSVNLLEDDVFRDSFERIGLLDWLLVFGGELSELWSHKFRWQSFSEFTTFSRHVERLLWQYGVITYPTPDGQVRAEIPIGTDALALAAHPIS